MVNGGSTGYALSRCATSTTGSSRIAACGRRASTTSNATSRRCQMPRTNMNDTDATLVALDGQRWNVSFERTLPHPPEKVWRALTEAEHLKAWFPTTIEGGW